MQKLIGFLLFSIFSIGSFANTCETNESMAQFSDSLCDVVHKAAGHNVSGDPKFEQAFEESYQQKLSESLRFQETSKLQLDKVKQNAEVSKKEFDTMIYKIVPEANGKKAGLAEYKKLLSGSTGPFYNQEPEGSLTHYVFESLGLTQSQLRVLFVDNKKATVLRNYINDRANLLRREIDPERTEQYTQKIKRNKEKVRAKLADTCGGEGRQVTVNYGMNTELGQTTDLARYAELGDINHAVQRLINTGTANSDNGRGMVKVGSFKTEGEAYGMLRSMEASDAYGICGIARESVKPETIGYYGPKMVQAYFGSGNIFKDNSSELNSEQDADLKKMTTQLPPNQKLKVKIYTCASLLRNCARGSTDGGDCQIIDQMRNASDEDLLKTTTNEKLKKLLGNPAYQKALSEMKKSDYYTDSTAKAKNPKNQEQRLWLALSTLRALQIEENMKANLNRSDIEYELVPTGDPADPYNNSKIDPALSGTCGPLAPQAPKEFYSGPDVSSCDMKKQLVAKMNKVYESEEVKKTLAADRKKNIKSDSNSTADNYGMHRYANIEVETVPTTPPASSSPPVDVYVVRCSQNADHCEHWKKGLPRINLPRIPLPSISFGFGGGSGGGGPFKDVCKAYPNR